VFNLNVLIILVIGIFLGLLAGNRSFRTKFFVSFRKFVAQLGQGARSYSAQQRKGSSGKQVSGRPDAERVKHRYTQEHHLVKCPRCEGTGRIPKAVPNLLDKKLFGGQTEECPDCEGTGKIYD